MSELPTHTPWGERTYFEVPIPNHPVTARLREAIAKIDAHIALCEDASEPHRVATEYRAYLMDQAAAFADGEAITRWNHLHSAAGSDG